MLTSYLPTDEHQRFQIGEEIEIIALPKKDERSDFIPLVKEVHDYAHGDAVVGQIARVTHYLGLDNYILRLFDGWPRGHANIEFKITGYSRERGIACLSGEYLKKYEAPE